MAELDQQAKKVIRLKAKGSFAEFRNGNLVAEILTGGREMMVSGIGRIEIGDVVNGLASYILEQTDGTIVEVPPNYNLISFWLQEET